MTPNLSGFTALPLRIKSDSTTTHTLYMKGHSARENDDSKPSNRTLFVLSVPPFVDHHEMNKIFGVAGQINSVELSAKSQSYGKPDVGFKTCHIVYKDESGLKKALRLRTLSLDCEDSYPNKGFMKWIRNYNEDIPDVEKMKSSIDEYIESYDRKVKEKIEAEKAAGEADDEGWITVTRQGRKPGFERKESVTNKIAVDNNAKRQKKELKNFYTFQIRESKMNHIVSLRKKFEEDKKKIALLKQTRRFKPF